MVDDILEQCHSLQREEWEVLEAIYPDYASNDISEISLKLEVPIEFGDPRSVSILDALKLDSVPNNTTSNSQTLSLSLLPPLLLHILLPPSYPIRSPPEVLSIRATHLWMPHIAQLHMRLLEMWQEGEGVLYTWIEFIRSGQFLERLGLTKLSGAVEFHHATPHLLAPLLSSYESTARFDKFRQNSYPCSICLSYFKGSRCLQLSCGHIFCRSCLEDFWGLCIKEGDIGRVGCADPQCVKAGRLAEEEEIARVVTNEEVVRWRWLKEKVAMEKDPTIMHCPMVLCQKPVPKPRIPDPEESGWQRLRTCSACSYSFCSFCKRTWHGPVSPCPISTYETLVLEYMALPEGSRERILLEQRFGRATITKLVTTYQEEQLLKQWLTDSATACPGCNVQIEKSLGCNHMTCVKCGQHFCYRCGAKLDASSPYKHFSTPGQSCFNKLFDFNSAADDWEPVEGFFE